MGFMHQVCPYTVFNMELTYEGNTVAKTVFQRISHSWYFKMEEEVWQSDWLQKIANRVAEERKTKLVYPKSEDVLNAYKTDRKAVKCLILGMDPYPNENANGYAFSCAKKLSPSLRRIFQTITAETGTPIDSLDITLSNWIEQGVMLLNTILTVRAGESNSHKDFGWQRLVHHTIQNLPEGVPVMLWGGNAKAFKKSCEGRPTVTAEHPIAGVYRGNEPWNHNDCFNEVNKILIEQGKEPIDW